MCSSSHLAGLLFGLLAIIGIGVIIATTIVPSDAVLISRIVPQVQITIRGVVTIGLVVPRAAEPPSGAICSLPGGLSCSAGGHCAACASTAPVLGTGHIDNPMWTPKLCGRADESLPVLTRGR